MKEPFHYHSRQNVGHFGATWNVTARKKNTVDTTLDRVFVVVGREFDMCLACCLIISLLPQHNVVKATGGFHLHGMDSVSIATTGECQEGVTRMRS